MYKLLVLFVFFYTDFALAASVYKCTVDGVTKYSQLPCGEVNNKVEKYKFETNTKVDGLANNNESTNNSNNKSTK